MRENKFLIDVISCRFIQEKVCSLVIKLFSPNIKYRGGQGMQVKLENYAFYRVDIHSKKNTVKKNLEKDCSSELYF